MPREESRGPIHVLVASKDPTDIRPRLDELGPEFSIRYQPSSGRAAYDQIKDAAVEVLIGSFVPRDLNQIPRLRWLQVSSAGVDHLLADAPWQRGLTVTNARGVFAPAIGQYVLAAILRINERTDDRQQAQLAHEWPTRDAWEWLTGRMLRGQTVLVVGYGGLGREVARLAHALGMRVIAAKRDPEVTSDHGYCAPGTGDPDGALPERVVAPSDLGSVVPLADVVVVTLPLTDETRGMFDARLIAAMRPDAWLINVGRGALVDEAALADALIGRRIGGAVLDVFGTEPLPASSPFWDAPNTVVTPHLSGGDIRAGSNLAELYAENLLRYSRGEPLMNVVNGDRQY
jgi:phosphoglycerate dehydrogenase-like enzyme